MCTNAIVNSIGDADIDEDIVRLVLEKEAKENEAKKAHKNKCPREQNNQGKPIRSKKPSTKKSPQYMTNNSVLGKLDAGTKGKVCQEVKKIN